MRGGLPQRPGGGATNPRGAGGGGAGARAARVRPRLGGPRPTQARGPLGLGLSPGTPRGEARPVCVGKDLSGGRRPKQRPTFRSRPEARSLLPSARKCEERLIPPPAGSQEATLPGRARPAPHLLGIRERRRESQPRTVAGTTQPCCRSASHSNPGKMARRRGCGPGACVSGAEAGGGARSAQAPPKLEWPIATGSVFALTSQAPMPFGSDRGLGHHNPYIPENEEEFIEWPLECDQA